ncbi:hypothetical protein AB0K16_22250 [Nonomuraea jabiensis]|uniref:hypothetical protein n=1 Tax=Nonomuraea jabiensis TaxID=882448 RepID=UPI003434340F
MSPYADQDQRVRERAATNHLRKMRIRQTSLLAEWNTLDREDLWEIKRIKNLLQAVTNHIASYERYIREGCPLEPRAQVTASTYAHLIESR